MKSIIYSTLVALSLSFMSTAQNPSAIAKMPAEANGYLILNKGFYNTVSSWRVVVKEKTPGPTRNTYTYITKLDQTLVGKNYLKIPAAYRTTSHIMEITGYAGTTTVVQANETVIEGPSELICSWICNGSNYAYALELNIVPSQGAKARMWMAPPPEDEPYYYQWFSFSDWTNLISNPANLPLAAHYGLSSWDEQNAGDAIIHVDLDGSTGEYKVDQFGTPMTGAVVGVSKYFGPYTDYFDLIYSDPLYLTGSECSLDISYALAQVNNGPNTLPATVICSGTSYNTNAVDVPYAEVMDPEAADNDPCFEDYYDYLGWNPGSGSGVYQLIQIPCNWINVPDPGTGTGTGIHWPEHVTRITMKSTFGSVSGDPVTIVLENENLFNELGNFVGPNYSVPAGFYNIIYQYEDLSIASYFAEVTTTTGSVVAEKDFLSYTAYPVPIVDNNFRIDFAASKKVEFTYELRDGNNNLLFTDHYTVLKDEQVTKEIEPTVAIPDGMLYNRFIFSDNSIVNFTTVK